MTYEDLFKDIFEIISDPSNLKKAFGDTIEKMKEAEDTSRKVEIKTGSTKSNKDIDDLKVRYDLHDKRLNSLTATVSNLSEKLDSLNEILGDVVFAVATMKKGQKEEHHPEHKCNCDECHGCCDECHCGKLDEDDDEDDGEWVDADFAHYCDNHYCDLDWDSDWDHDDIEDDELDEDAGLEELTPKQAEAIKRTLEDAEIDEMLDNMTSSVLAFLNCEVDNLIVEKTKLYVRRNKAETAEEFFDYSSKLDKIDDRIDYLHELIKREEISN